MKAHNPSRGFEMTKPLELFNASELLRLLDAMKRDELADISSGIATCAALLCREEGVRSVDWIELASAVHEVLSITGLEIDDQEAVDDVLYGIVRVAWMAGHLAATKGYERGQIEHLAITEEDLDLWLDGSDMRNEFPLKDKK